MRTSVAAALLAFSPLFTSSSSAVEAPIPISLEQRVEASKEARIVLEKSDLGAKSGIHKQFVQLIHAHSKKDPQKIIQLTAVVDDFYQGLVRGKIKADIERTYPDVFIYGSFLDEVTRKISEKLKASEHQSGTFMVKVPDYFFVKNPPMHIHVNKSKLTIVAYQQWNGYELPVFRGKVAIGAIGTQTREGTFWLSRVTYLPKWFPPKDHKLHGTDQPVGLNSALGLWAMDFTRHDIFINYGYPSDGTFVDTLVHTTNKYESIETRASLGCIRTYPHQAHEFFPAMRFYFGRRDEAGNIEVGKKAFGYITPFSEKIKMTISFTDSIK